MSELTIPWGALPYYRMHFVVLARAKPFAESLIAQTRKKTKGVIHKEIIDVWWEGGRMAEELNRDDNLKTLLKEVLLEEDEIYVDPTENCIRVYGGWKGEQKVEISKKTLEAYNIIAGHVKKLISELAVPIA